MRSSNDTQHNDDVRWLALLIRQGLKIIVVGIEKRYGLESNTSAEMRSAHDRRVTERRARC